MAYTTSSHHSSNFMVNLYEKQITTGGFIKTLVTDDNSYSQKVNAFGGADAADFRVTIHEHEIPEWLSYGLGRWVKVTDPELRVIWCGFINEISLTVSGLDYKLGPVTGINNRVRAKYTPQQVDVNPPITESEQVTPWGNNLDSQREFGIIEETIGGYNVDSTTALSIRDLWIKENSWPAREGNYRGDSDGYSVSISCLGPQHSLNFFTFTHTSFASYTFPAYMISQVMAQNPNSGYISDDIGFLDGNIHQFLYTYQATGVRGLDAIRGLVEIGTSSNEKTLFWIDADGYAHYAVAPTQPEYFTTLKDASRRIFRADGTEIQPWAVQPGKWIQYQDLPISTDSGNLAQDPRNFFIESISYSMPYGLEINGASVKTINQRLAALALMSSQQ